MAQDPEEFEGQEEESGAVDPSSDLDTVTLYMSQTVDAEIEADIIRGLLESNGIPSTIIRSPYPNLGVEIEVPQNRLEEAQRVIEEAQAAGPEAAAEAEAAGEEQNPTGL
jgi:hypothetical protein